MAARTQIQDGQAYQSLTENDQAELWKICEERGFTHEVDVAGDGLCVGRACAPSMPVMAACLDRVPGPRSTSNSSLDSDSQ